MSLAVALLGCAEEWVRVSVSLVGSMDGEPLTEVNSTFAPTMSVVRARGVAGSRDDTTLLQENSVQFPHVLTLSVPKDQCSELAFNVRTVWNPGEPYFREFLGRCGDFAFTVPWPRPTPRH